MEVRGIGQLRAPCDSCVRLWSLQKCREQCWSVRKYRVSASSQEKFLEKAKLALGHGEKI